MVDEYSRRAFLLAILGRGEGKFSHGRRVDDGGKCQGDDIRGMCMEWCRSQWLGGCLGEVVVAEAQSSWLVRLNRVDARSTLTRPRKVRVASSSGLMTFSSASYLISPHLIAAEHLGKTGVPASG